MIDTRQNGPHVESQETEKSRRAAYSLPQKALDKMSALVQAGLPWLYKLLPAGYMAIVMSIPAWLAYLSAALFSRKLALALQEESMAQDIAEIDRVAC